MRPSALFFCMLGLFVLFQAILGYRSSVTGHGEVVRLQRSAEIVRTFGLSDLCLATDARYLRHPGVSDPVAPYMDHPRALDSFPASIFRRPVR